MENYGFISGISSVISRKLVPVVPAEDTFEFYLRNSNITKSKLDEAYDEIKTLLSDPSIKTSISNDLNKAIIALTTKIISFGMDREFQNYFEKLKIESGCYQKLVFQVNVLCDKEIMIIPDFQKNLDNVYNTIVELRRNKNVIGTSLHLTVVTKRILSYIDRTRDLLNLKQDICDQKSWEQLIIEYLNYNKSKRSLRSYFNSHTDLLALEIVEHTAEKGEHYVAENKTEYREFFRKGLTGGAIISLFALFKIIIDANIETTIPLALLYSINYALCFIIVKFIGGTIATKQPAMTASTIIKHIDKDDDLKFDTIQDIILLFRKVSRSQFISLMGNFFMAFSLSCLIGFLLTLGFTSNPINADKSSYLIQQVFPFSGGAVYFAAIAGLFLSLSGFISGYFDNKVVASNLPYRIQHNQILSKVFSRKNRDRLARYLKKNLGVIAGNVSLGFFLGSAFLMSYLLPGEIDIRHIAFSSSNVGYGIINNAFSFSTIILALVSVLIIGSVNFLISFSLTFIIVLKSRGITASDIRQLIVMSFKDLLTNPLDYFVIRNGKS
jgi:site-specific recombinase